MTAELEKILEDLVKTYGLQTVEDNLWSLLPKTNWATLQTVQNYLRRLS